MTADAATSDTLTCSFRPSVTGDTAPVTLAWDGTTGNDATSNTESVTLVVTTKTTYSAGFVPMTWRFRAAMASSKRWSRRHGERHRPGEYSVGFSERRLSSYGLRHAYDRGGTPRGAALFFWCTSNGLRRSRELVGPCFGVWL